MKNGSMSTVIIDNHPFCSLMHLSSASTLVVSILENMSFEFFNYWSHGSEVAVLVFTSHVSRLKFDLLSIMALNIVDYVWPLRSTILILTDIHQYRMCKIISTGLIDVLPPAKHPLGSQTVVHEQSLSIALEEKGCWHSHCRLSQLKTNKNKKQANRPIKIYQYIFRCSRNR